MCIRAHLPHHEPSRSRITAGLSHRSQRGSNWSMFSLSATTRRDLGTVWCRANGASHTSGPRRSHHDSGIRGWDLSPCGGRVRCRGELFPAGSEKVTGAPLHVVTGAFGYTGRYIATELLARGARVRTLTNSLDRGDPFGDAVEVHPIDFHNPGALVNSLQGAYAFHNTYWVRYDYKKGSADFDYATAVENSRVLFDCARTAGVRRVVHVSVANASEDSDWGYFRGKALLEQELRTSGLSYAVVRPTVIYGGPESVLINNIAWLLRHLPVFGVFGRGEARLTPIYVEDLARICVNACLLYTS